MVPGRPTTRLDFGIAIICALSIEADAVRSLFDHDWEDDGPPFDKAPGDPNAYSTGLVGRHNVVLAYMPGMGKAHAATAAVNCRTSFPNIKLALVVGVCGAVPFIPGTNTEIILGDVIVSRGIIQHDFGRRLPDGFMRKNNVLDSLRRPNTELRALFAKLDSIHNRKKLTRKLASHLEELQRTPELDAVYPGIRLDNLFESSYRHIKYGKTCAECGCSGKLVERRRLDRSLPQPAVHLGLIASGDTIIKDGEERDKIAQGEGVIGFEMEGAGVWDTFSCVIIKGACDYADSHKSKRWQRYAAATAAACTKAFLEYWVPSVAITHNSPSIREVFAGWTAPFDDGDNTCFAENVYITKSQRDELTTRASPCPDSDSQQPDGSDVGLLLPTDTPEVPDGWAARFDDKYETWFYINLFTKQTQWEKPETPETLEVPEGWAARFDDTYETWFYINLATKKSQWEKPETPETQEPAAQPDTPEVPEGWAARLDDKYQTWFYVNLVTKQSQWERPTTPTTLDPAAQLDVPEVPEGWTARFNDKYQTWFFVNTLTMKSQWDKPTAPATRAE